jgi:hypothetical protein
MTSEIVAFAQAQAKAAARRAAFPAAFALVAGLFVLVVVAGVFVRCSSRSRRIVGRPLPL